MNNKMVYMDIIPWYWIIILIFLLINAMKVHFDIKCDIISDGSAGVWIKHGA